MQKINKKSIIIIGDNYGFLFMWYGYVINWIVSMYNKTLRSRIILEKLILWNVVVSLRSQFIKLISIILIFFLLNFCNEFILNLYFLGFIGKVLIFFIIVVNLDMNILYMRRVFGAQNQIWFRFYTKKKLFKKYCPKRQYSYYTNNKDKIVIENHDYNLIVSMQIGQKQQVVDVFNHFIIRDDKVERLLGLDNRIVYNQLNKFLINYQYKIEQETNKFFSGNEKKVVLKAINDYKNNNISCENYNTGIALTKYNFTTSYRNSINLVELNKISIKPLNKGINLHKEDVMFSQVYSDKDFVQVYLYILKNLEDDLRQKIIIENYTHVKNLDELYNAETLKILKQIKINQIIIENNIKTKTDLIKYLYENWDKIRQ